jgi:PhnB protein
MAKPTRPIPQGYHAVTPYLVVDGAARAIAFYTRAFGASVAEEPIKRPNGTVAHAEIAIGDSRVMIADPAPEMEAHPPGRFGGSPITLHLYVDDVDKVVRQAEAEGAVVKRKVQDMFYGDRTGSLADPFGHVWHVATHKEDVDRGELERRLKAMQAA